MSTTLKIVIGIIILIVLVVGSYFVFFHHGTAYQFVTVKRGSITESVSITGNTTPTQSVSLTFGTSGIVSNTSASLGEEVHAGQVLAEIDTSDLVAQLHNAEAALTIAEENATTSVNNVTNVTAEQDSLVASAWQNLHGNLAAIPTSVSTTNPSPIISGSYTGTSDGSYTISVYASSGGEAFNYSGLESGTGLVTTGASVALGTHGLYITFPSSVSLSSYVGSDWTVNIPNPQWNGYASALEAYQTAMATRDTAIANAEASIGNANTSAVINAQIAEAQANVDSVEAKIQDAKIVAPITGTVTQFDAKVGQLASPGTPLISIISNTGYEVDAGLSETDVGKVTVGNPVSMTLDAFPNEIFTGSVFYIAPAETNTQGVISYLVKISFDKADPRLKSGLTANIDIQTSHKDNVLILPQYAILQNDNGTFVETLLGKTPTTTPVTLGIQDQSGNVEVVSGVTEGEKVINIGLKS